MPSRFPTFYLTHGGGPWPYMTGPMREMHSKLEASLKDLPRQLPAKPEAILVISGHWESADFAVMGNPAPPMLYDFGGFPREMYQIQYAAPGAPELAKRAEALIQQAGLHSHLDGKRGFDHGTYSILSVSYPQADVPVIQVSIRSDYSPAEHLKLGRALAPLRDQGILIIASGSSYHDLRGFFSQDDTKPKRDSAEFDAWLQETLVHSTGDRRSNRLLNWEQAPAARAAHPREDHLISLHVAVGAAEQEAGQVVYWQDDFFGKLTLSSYRFGD